MRLVNDKEFGTPPADHVEATDRFKQSAIAYLFSDPTLELVKLSERDYMEGQIAYRSQQNEQELMLSATLKAVATKMSAQDDYNILSIGCGSGLFENPFLTELLSQNKAIYFVGVDPNQEECAKVQAWCDQLQATHSDRFSFELHPTGFEDFQTNQAFDIVLFIHTIYYFSDIESAVRKSYDLLKQSGMTIITVSKRWLLNDPFYYVLQKTYGKPAWFTQELQQALTDFNIPFCQEQVDFLVNITQCFQPGSTLGRKLLNFMLGVSADSFELLQLQLLLDYFGASSQIMPEGDIMLPHSGTLFYLEKEG